MVGISLSTTPQRPSYYVIEVVQPVSEGVHMRVARPHVWRPPTDVYETEDSVIVRVEIAGMRDADFSIVLDGRYLSIRGMRPDIQERRAYHQMEIPFGEFQTEVELASPVQAQGIDAVYTNGFLRITLPRAFPQKIQVEE